MESIVATQRLGAWFDGDVQLTADGVPVLWHDNRLPDGSMVGDENIAEVVDQGVIRLKRLARYAARHNMPTLLEIKRISTLTNKDVQVVGRAIHGGGASGRTLLGAGDFGGLKRIRALLPRMHVYWRSDRNEPLTTAAAANRGASLVQARPDRWTPDLVSDFRAAGYCGHSQLGSVGVGGRLRRRRDTAAGQRTRCRRQVLPSSPSLDE
jgi:hypothetical protein